MIRRTTRFATLLCAAALLGAASLARPAELSFRIDEGSNINSFVRDEATAAHVLLRSGVRPRILVAFPAGNSGVGLWFRANASPVAWTLIESPRPVSGRDAKGRTLHGVEVEAIAHADALVFERAVLSSVRVLRDFELSGAAPDEIAATPERSETRIEWRRDRLDGAPGYALAIEALEGARIDERGITSGRDGAQRLRLRIRALTGETPLTPLRSDALLTRAATRDERARNVLAFLSYREKYLAGSWRFNTYFGRDTLLSLMLLAPVLEPEAVESGVGAVLERLAPNGEVAHEEDIGEFAILRNLATGRGRTAAPIYDYGMIDDDFLLAPLVARWIEQHGASRARAFFARRMPDGETYGKALLRNLLWVVERTAPFAAQADYRSLISIKEGRNAGQWRDSEEGLGRGRYPYDVNAVFAPAALHAIARILESGVLDEHASARERDALRRAEAQHRVWKRAAPALFVASMPASQARERIAAYARSIGVDAERALASLPEDSLELRALSLDESGRALPVLHSDESFALLFGEPPPQELLRSVETMMRPFPAGLYTPIGLLVANPALADAATQQRFTSSAYHGTVVWSWQQALLAAGLKRQLARDDLPQPVRDRLARAHDQLTVAIDAAREVRTSELWSWSFANGRYRIEPFGARGGDEDESNAAQLWSTVYLAGMAE